MNQSKQQILSILFGALLVQAVLAMPVDAHKRPITITERQEILMRDVSTAEKSGELTRKEADKLRDFEAKIVNKETSMKDKNGGKLSYADIAELEKAYSS